MDKIVLTETWSLKDYEIQIDNFDLFNYRRTCINSKAKRASGGIGIYVKENIAHLVTPLSNYNDNIVWLKVDKCLTHSDKDTALCAVYFPPQGSICNLGQEDYFLKLEQDCAKYHEFQLLICGDFNARTKNNSDIPVNAMGSENPCAQNNVLVQSDEFPPELQQPRASKDTGTNEYGKKNYQLL
jgi:hypothetical protein